MSSPLDRFREENDSHKTKFLHTCACLCKSWHCFSLTRFPSTLGKNGCEASRLRSRFVPWFVPWRHVGCVHWWKVSHTTTQGGKLRSAGHAARCWSRLSARLEKQRDTLSHMVSGDCQAHDAQPRLFVALFITPAGIPGKEEFDKLGVRTLEYGKFLNQNRSTDSCGCWFSGDRVRCWMWCNYSGTHHEVYPNLGMDLEWENNT